MEPQSSSNDDHTQYQAQDWQGPEAGHWLVPISLLSTAYVPAELLPGWVRSAAAVNPTATWSTPSAPP